MKPRLIAAILASSILATPLAAESNDSATVLSSQSVTQSAQVGSTNPLTQFAPAADQREHRIDYQHWDEALGFFVIPMGPSIREGAPRVEPGTGTRRIYGHESRYRLEGNRVAFSYLTDEVRQALTDYRVDLEQVGSTLDLTRIPRNEQLAFWLNLHNVAVIEALAYEYPLSEPAERAFGSNDAGLDDAKLVTISGVELSPRDIRERIVYPNWKDPKVIYGFWRGVIGGPSIQRLAYTGDNVDALLSLAGEEFVNSLRGVEKYGGKLRVSRIYEEAKPVYFEDFDAIRAHLAQYAADDVMALLNDTELTDYNRYEAILADMSRGERDPGLNFVCSAVGGSVGANPLAISATFCSDNSTRPNPATQRLINERREKIDRAIKRGIRTGMVIYGDGQYSDADAGKEVE